MERDKLLRAVKELHLRSLTRGNTLGYRVITGSMRFLISPGDEVIIRGVQGYDIHWGDIVAWYVPRQGEYPVIHRVVRRERFNGGCRYRTKGDFNNRTDPWIAADQLLGKVVEIRKTGTGRRIRLDTKRGKFESLMWYGITFACAGATDRLARIKAFMEPLFFVMNPAAAAEDDLLSRYGAATDIADWMALTENVEHRIDASLSLRGGSPKVADVQAPAGFSEEASIFARKGIPVEPLNVVSGDAGGERRYDCAVVARCVNLIPHRDRRLELFSRVRESLKEKGKMLVTVINAREPAIMALLLLVKRKIMSPFFRAENAPGNAVVRESKFIRYNCSFKALGAEIERAGFSIVSHSSGGRWFSIVAEKRDGGG